MSTKVDNARRPDEGVFSFLEFEDNAVQPWPCRTWEKRHRILDKMRNLRIEAELRKITGMPMTINYHVSHQQGFYLGRSITFLRGGFIS
jgi:hypothetical protein